jgi:hypothetical protein
MTVIPLTQAPETQAPGTDPLELLARQAANQEAADNADTMQAQAQPGEAEAAPAMSNAQCFSMVLEMLRDVLCSFAKVETPKVTLSADKIAPAADALGAVADKYGLNLAGAASNYMIEIKAALIVVPMLLAFRAGLMTEIAADNAKQQAEKTASSGIAAPMTDLEEGIVHVVG